MAEDHRVSEAGKLLNPGPEAVYKKAVAKVKVVQSVCRWTGPNETRSVLNLMTLGCS